MKTVVYCKEGVAVSDFDAEDWVELFKKAADGTVYKVSTSLPFDIIRREIVKGNIAFESVEFEFEGKKIPINKYGAIPNWPRGFCDKVNGVAEDIIREAVKMRKAERGGLKVSGTRCID